MLQIFHEVQLTLQLALSPQNYQYLPAHMELMQKLIKTEAVTLRIYKPKFVFYLQNVTYEANSQLARIATCSLSLLTLSKAKAQRDQHNQEGVTKYSAQNTLYTQACTFYLLSAECDMSSKKFTNKKRYLLSAQNHQYLVCRLQTGPARGGDKIFCSEHTLCFICRN